MAAIHFTTIECEPNRAFIIQGKPHFLQYLFLCYQNCVCWVWRFQNIPVRFYDLFSCGGLVLVQASYHFSEANFQDFSRTQIDFSRTRKFTVACSVFNSSYCLPYISYSLLTFNRSPALSRTSSPFPGVSSPGKCHRKILELSRFSKTHTNPALLVTALIGNSTPGGDFSLKSQD